MTPSEIPALDASMADVPMAAVVDTIRLEIEDLAAAADDLQALAGDLMQRAGCMHEAGMMREAQKLDAVVQRLQGLGCFLEGLGPAIGAHWRVDPEAAATHVRLALLADRLSFRKDTTVGELVDCDDGDAEFF